MGMFDTVLVPCPKCGTENEFQSKGGDCSLNVYKLKDCPPDVMSDVNCNSPTKCEKCGVRYFVDYELGVIKAVPTEYKEPEDSEED